jgi:hypothetical protein
MRQPTTRKPFESKRRTIVWSAGTKGRLTWIIDRKVGCDEVFFAAGVVFLVAVVGAILNVSEGCIALEQVAC